MANNRKPDRPSRLRWLLTAPAEQLSRGQYFLRYALELFRQGYHQLVENRAGQMAAALAFRTIFGLVPVLVIVILIFRAFGGAEVFSDFLGQILAAANLDYVRSPDASMTMAEWLRAVVATIDEKVSGKAIGLIGALVLAWAAIGLITTVERSFNTICQSQERRSWGRRIPLYWTMLTVGPALIYLSFHFKAQFMKLVTATGWTVPFARTLTLSTSFLSVWLLLLALYLLVPHTRMRLKASAGGAFVAAILWTAATNLFGWYIAWSFRSESSAFTILYSALGLVPLFLLWIYFLWFVVLYGLEIAYCVQVTGKRLASRAPMRAEPPVVVDPAAIILLMKAASDAFGNGKTIDSDGLADAVNAPPNAIDAMLVALTARGLLHKVDDDEPAYALARDPATIQTSELIDIALSLAAPAPDPESAAAQWVERFRTAQRGLKMHGTLADV